MNNTYSGTASGVSKAVLKNVAIISMIIDHFFALLFRYYMNNGLIVFKGANDIYSVGRMLGRPAFFLFAFMIADGMNKTGNRLKYIRNLFLFAFISEIPYDLVHEDVFFEFGSQNVYVTLALGALCIYLTGLFEKRKWLAYILCGLLAVSAFFLKSDYGTAGVLLILLLYLCIDDYYKMIVLPTMVFIFVHALQWYFKDNGFVFDIKDYLMHLFTSVTGEMLGVTILVLVYFYDGRRGKQLNKWFYYLVYPVHLLLFYLIKLFT